MRFGKLFISLFTAALLLAAVLFAKSEYVWDGTVSVSAVITAREGTEEISCWQKTEEEYYLFLPGYAELSQLQLRTNTITPVYLDGARITDGMSCAGLQTDTPYELCYGARDSEHRFVLTIFQSEDMPALFLDTASGSMEHIHTLKGNEEPGSMRLYTRSGELNYRGNLESVKGRGNSTWDYEKKPYNLTLNAQGDLLGMGAATRWILLANAMDPSHIRNKVVYDFARDAGMDYTPQCQWVDLYVNGAYAGLYLLSERNEVHSERVAIGEENSFLISKDWEWRFESSGQPYITTESRAALRIHYSSLPEEELRAIVQEAEYAILEDYGFGFSPEQHWRDLIDTDSWAEKYLIEEIFANPDAATLSQFFYYDGNGDGKLHAGPVWDFDLSMANGAAHENPAANRYFANRPTIYGSYWFNALYMDEEFYSRVVSLYETTFQPLLQQLLSGGLEDYARRAAGAARMDSLRWDTANMAEEVESLQQYMTERMEFLNSVWLEEEESVYVLVRTYDEVQAYGLRPGEVLPELPVFESNAATLVHGWYNMDTNEPIDVTQPIYEDTQIELRYEAIPQPEVEEVWAEEWTEEPSEPLSLLRLGPVLVFLGLFGAVALVGLLRMRRK